MDGKSLEAYLTKAEEAERIAAETKDETARAQSLALAKGWRDLAAQLKRVSEFKH